MIYYLCSICCNVRVGSARSHCLSGGKAINTVVEKARPTVEDVLARLGYELVDMEYKTLYGEKHMIIYVAKDGGISLDDCEAVSNALDAPLDALDPTDGAPYCLDVSSPGLDRPFKTQRDFERNYGEIVDVKLYAPMEGCKDKLLVGTLVERTADETVIDVDGEKKRINNAAAALVRPHVEI